MSQQQPPPPPTLPHQFNLKKSKILSQLSIPITEYDDLSPKGSIDVGIRDLIDEINALDGFVTTSSCAGRVSVYLDGQKSKATGEIDTGEGDGREAGEVEVKSGGKGGGRWLFVSHDPVVVDGAVERDEGGWAGFLGLRPFLNDGEEKGLGRESRLVHFKFEPMILHVLTSSLVNANLILSAALQAGFRESGALGLLGEPATPMVGIRSMGLSLESIIGFEINDELRCLTPEWQLRHLVEVSNERFKENVKRIERFRGLLSEMVGGKEEKRRGKDGEEWEDKDARRERKMMEGKARAEAVRREKEERASGGKENGLDVGGLEI